jgi:hypothetical protein
MRVVDPEEGGVGCAHFPRSSARSDTALAAGRLKRTSTAQEENEPQISGGADVIVMFSARRLKPGAWEQFRRAWDPGESKPPGFQRAYHARNIRDEDEVVSFGLFDMTKDEYHRWRAEADAQEMQRVDHVSAFVESEPVSGVYEVIDTLDE